MQNVTLIPIITIFIIIISFISIYRADKAKAQYLYGHQAMVATTQTRVTVTDIRTVFIRCQFRVSLKLGMLKLLNNTLLIAYFGIDKSRMFYLYIHISKLTEINLGIWKNVHLH